MKNSLVIQCIKTKIINMFKNFDIAGYGRSRGLKQMTLMEKVRRNMRYKTYIRRFSKMEIGYIMYKNRCHVYNIDNYRKIMDRLYKNSDMERDK